MKKLLRLLIPVILLAAGTTAVQAVVVLSSFTADVQDTEIVVEWETATEFDNAGFYLTRNTQEAGDYETISEFIPAAGSGVSGADYVFTDTNVTEGPTYFYILEAIDNNQGVDTYGPVNASLATEDATATQTITLTATATTTETMTVTPTATYSGTLTITLTPSRTPSRTNTPSRTPSQTPTDRFTPSQTNTRSPTIPPAPTDTPVVTAIPTATSTLTPSFTPSVAPIPDILLQAPEVTQPTETFVPPATPTQGATSTNLVLQESPMTRYRPLVIVLIVLLWFVVAGGGFYFWYTHQNPDEVE